MLITGRNEVVAKVMFLHLSVILFTGGDCLSVCWTTPLPRRPPLCQGDPRPAKETSPAKETPPSGPHPRGKLRGIRSRPTPKGEIEGDQIQSPP